MSKKIKKLLVEGSGWMYAKDEPIEVFTKNGEMALVDWYRQGNLEVNGKYVVKVVYENKL